MMRKMTGTYCSLHAAMESEFLLKLFVFGNAEVKPGVKRFWKGGL